MYLILTIGTPLKTTLGLEASLGDKALIQHNWEKNENHYIQSVTYMRIQKIIMPPYS